MELHKYLESKAATDNGGYKAIIVLEQTAYKGKSWLVIIDGEQIRYDDYKDVQNIVKDALANDFVLNEYI